MAKRATKTEKPPLCKVGDRIRAGTWLGTVVSTNYTKPFPYKIKWDNGQEAIIKEKEFSLRKYQILAPEPEVQDIEEEELNLWEQCGDNDPPDFFREKSWKVGVACFSVGDRVRVTNPNTPESVTSYEWVVDGFVAASSLTGDLDLIIIKRFTDDKGSFTTRSFESQWLCKISELVDSLKDREASPVQLNLLRDSIGESPSRMTKTRSKSSKATSATKSLPQTSEIFTQVQVNMTSLLEDSPVQTHQEPETGLELLTYLQNQEQCSASFSELLEKPDPNLCFWNSLPDLSIEDLERGWEDCAWADTKASIQSSRALINLERSLRGSDYLSFPTLLSGRGRKHRDVGNVHCETWFKKSGVIPTGSQLSSEAIALLHGFPANWYRNISPPSVAQPVTLDDSQPESLEAKPSASPKPESPSNGSNGCGQSLTDSGLVISFGKAYPQLLAGKSVTRRLWKFNHAQKFIRAYQKGLRVQALNKDQRYGGKQVGWLTLLEEPYQEPLHQMPVKDLEAEGFSELSLTEFCDRFFEGIRELTPWVIRFRFEPLPERALEHPDDSLEKSQPLTKQTGSVYQYTAIRAGKNGKEEYPKVEGDRKRDEDSHWYWGFSYVEKSNGKWRDKSASIPKKRLTAVRQALRDEKPYTYILREILGKD